jgi:hypothetical protein
VGATTATTGAFTSITASTTLGVTGVSTLTGGAVVQGMTVGLGAGSISTNTAVGYQALSSNTTGFFSTAIGFEAGATANAEGITVVGYRAGKAITTSAYFSTFVGEQSGLVTTEAGNTGIGALTLLANTSGANNFAGGREVLKGNTTGSSNTAVGGYNTMVSNTTGSNNTAVGRQALQANTTASNNTAVGYQAGYSNQTGQTNVFIGEGAGYSSTGGSNLAIGRRSGYSLTTGVANTFVGTGQFLVQEAAGYFVTTGSKNTILGNYNGNQGSLDIRTLDNQIVLSDGDGNPKFYCNGAANKFSIGNAPIDMIGTARVNIDGSGNATSLNLKGNNVTTPAGAYVWNATTTGDAQFFSFGTEASYTERGSITYNRTGGLTVYNTTSDYRAKDIIGPVTNSGALIDSVPVYMGKMKWATQERPMFIAHETPIYAHTGAKDAVDADGKPVYQQMDASALIPVMWAEIQSLRQRLSAANL